MTKQEWEKVLSAVRDEEEAAAIIMNELRGYGFEYGYSFDDDQANLVNALEAWAAVQHKQNRQPDPHQVAALFDQVIERMKLE